MAAVLNLCDTESCTGKIGVVLRIVFHHGQDRLFRVGEHETGVFSGVDLDDALCFVHQITIRRGNFLHGICARLQCGQVDLAVLVGHIFLGEGAAHQRNAELDIGQRLHRATVHLDDVDTGLDGVEEGQRFDTAACGQFDLLRRAVQHIACTGGNLFHQIGSRLEVGQTDLSHLVRGERADEDSIAGNFKGHIGQNFMGLLIILGDNKTRLCLIFQYEAGFCTGSHIDSIGLVVLDETAGCRHLAHLICTGFQLVEVHAAAEVGGAGLGDAAFDVLDLHSRTGERSAAVRVDLVHAQIAVGCIFKGDSRSISIVHGNGLGSFRAQQVPLGSRFLRNDILTGEGQRNNDLAAGIRDKAAEDRSIRCLYLESCTRKGRIRSGFYLFDDKGSFCGRFRLVRGIGRRSGIAAEGGLPNFSGRVGVAHIALEGAILAGLRAQGIVDGVLIDIGVERHLHRAGLVAYAVLGVQHLELTGIAGTIGRGPDLSDVVVVHVYDAGALRHFIGHGKSDVDVIVANPCFRIRCEHLLQVFLAVYGDGIGRIFIGCHRDGRLRHTVPPGTAFVDVLCRRQQFFTAFLLHTGQGRIDRQPVNAPAVDEIAPERHLRGVVRLILIVQLKFRQTTMGVAIGDDADDLRVVAGFVGNILDTLAGTDRLRHALCCRVDAVGRDFLDRAAGRLEIEVGIGLGTDNAVHAEIGHFIAAVGDIHLAQRTADGAAGGKSGDGEQPKRHHQHKEHRNQSFFQGHTSNLLCCRSDHPSV